ncbi:MAG: hypothetical protein KZQ76_14830, partial [Candidatus Thiodiazotropha sp. (ex Epidulcina cf. delphinae)]|nr:hypothetical protein [Candidatus Thiodiazotropha sp. (ex Epidulcina cf. delphinae)]
EKTGKERKVGSERLSDEEILISAVKELSSNADFASKSLGAIGFSQQGIDAATSNNPKALLSLEDMPEILRDALRIELEKSKKNGYDEVSEIEVDAITSIMNYIIGNDNSDPNITFSMSILPGSITRNFEYIGYTFPNYPAVNDPSIKIILYEGFSVGTMQAVC